MTTASKDTKSAHTEMAALAAEICDMWQEHLATLSSDPVAKADFMRLLEPQRQAFADLFADYTTMMQHVPHGQNRTSTATGTATPQDGRTASAPHGAAPTASAPDDSTLRLAQLAHRLAALEERVGKLESRHQSQTRRRARAASEESGD